MPGWSKWVDIEKNANHRGCGVYKIRLIDPKGDPVEIPRFLDMDNNGILQIGHSGNLQQRLRQFRGASGGRGYAHAEAVRFALIKKLSFLKAYKDCRIQYSFKKLPTKDGAKAEEELVLKRYFKKFGEVPPLNNNLPDKYIDWKSL